MPHQKFANPQYPQVTVWDLPTRLWHWALFLLLCFSVFSGLAGSITLMDWHLMSGYGLLVLLLFRLIWGFWGSSASRFQSYRDAWTRPQTGPVAHTRPGVLMLAGMLALLLLQTTSGLFATDDLFTDGPLNNYVSDTTASRLSWFHNRNFWLILALAAVHVLAIAYYGVWRKDPLAMSMFNGRKSVATATGKMAAESDTSELVSLSHPQLWWRALASLAIATTAVWALLTWF